MSYLAALVSGVLAALSFPTIVGGVHFPDLSWLAWLALIPYLLAIRHASGRRAAAQTFVFSLFWNALTSYWIFNALYFNGQLSIPASLGVLALMAFLLASLQAVFIPLALSFTRRVRLPWVLVLPSTWALYEWARNYFPFGGYPWANLGYSQAPWLTLLQSADLFGVYGLSFLIVLVNAALAETLALLWKRHTIPRLPLAATALLLLAFVGYGRLRLPQVVADLQNASSLKVGLLQPNIGQHLKWKPDLNDYIQRLLLKMTRDAAARGVDFVVWPESALPTALPLDLQEYLLFRSFTVPVLLGVLSTDPVPGREQPILFNTALQVEPGGRFAGRLHKQHLVPLGEYVPLRKILWFVEPIVPRIGDFRTASAQELLKVHGHPYGVTICYEDLFPEISRRFTRMGASFLINITNDAWYGDVSQLDQHLNFSKFRAVENRRSLVRGTNNGYTAAIDPTGRIHAEIPKFILGILLTEIPLQSGLSPYARFGDGLWIGLLAFWIALGVLFRRRARRPRA